LRETLVKFEISFADIGNYDDGDISGTCRGGAAPIVVFWSLRTARLERRQDWSKKDWRKGKTCVEGRLE
jgi:hypothetical protein